MWIAILAAVVVIIGLLISLYNKLAKQKVLVNEASSDIETFLKQRYDMIPNLVEIVKGYAKHEQDTFTKVTEMRTKAMSAGSLGEKMEYEKQLSGAITQLLAVAENYPELKANENFRELQVSLKALEDNIQKSRRFYNGTVRDFNSMIAVFPNSIIAGIMGYKAMPFFEASEEEKENVKIKF
ncbi:MAG: LemA family protein [Candidatus Dojkabacteria bacterium]|jgi:LemA protein|nr:LemA family protein [Candidatus Dojkabacteria bacterium]MDD2270530.1 LemA family protein [Candidatus Dojkabacteria bacterium]